MKAALDIFSPPELMFKHPDIALVCAIAASFLLCRMKDLRLRVPGLIILCLLPVVAFIVARNIDGCTGTLPEPTQMKREQCWGTYGFGGVMFFMIGMPFWLFGVGIGALIHRLLTRKGSIR